MSGLPFHAVLYSLCQEVIDIPSILVESRLSMVTHVLSHVDLHIPSVRSSVLTSALLYSYICLKLSDVTNSF